MDRKIKITMLLLLLFPAALFSQQITLKEAIETTLIKNDKIFQYKEKLAQKETEEKSAWGNFLPSIDLKASYTHLNDNMVINLNPIRDAIITIQSGNQAEFANISSILSGTGALSVQQKLQIKGQSANLLNSLLPQFEETFKKQDFKTATIQGIQPIFVGGKLIAAKKYATAEKDAAQIELTRISNEAVTETINSYLRVQLLKNVVKIREDALEGIKKHAERARKLFEEGIIAKNNVLRAEVALADAEKNLDEDKSNYNLSLLALKNAMGLEEDADISTADSITFHPLDESLGDAVKTALANQPILQFISEKKISARQNYNAALSSFLPTIAAFGKYEMYPEYLSSIEPRWAVGIQMNLSIFNGFKDHLNLQNAKHIENEVMYLQADAKKKVELWVNKAFMEMGKSRNKYEKLDATVALAKENLRQNEKRFETGMGISLEVIDARLAYEKVELDRYASLYEYYKAAADLFLADGDPSLILKIWNNQE